MLVDHSSQIDAAPARPGVVRTLRVVAPLVTASVLLQAVFAGRGLFIGADALGVHGALGFVTLVLVVLQATLFFLAGFRGEGRSIARAISLALVALVLVQLALGFAGRDGSQAAAWHVPNGVLIFGLSVANIALLDRVRGGTT